VRRRRGRRYALLIVAVALSATTVVAAVADSQRSSRSRRSRVSSPARTLASARRSRAAVVQRGSLGARMSAYPVQESAFRALRSQATPPASLRGMAARVAGEVSGRGNPELQPQLVRLVYASRDVTTGVFPTMRGLCFVAIAFEWTTSVCKTTAEASRSGLTLLLREKGEYWVTGVLPDGATTVRVVGADGAVSEPTRSVNNGYAARLGAAPSALLLASRGGATTEYSLGTAPPAGASLGAR